MELSDYRARIDQIDRQLVELFAQRMNTAAGIAAYKKEHGLPVLDPVREREKLLDVAAQAPEDLPAVVRRRVRDAMVEHHILERMVHDIRWLLLTEEEQTEEPDVVYLWDNKVGAVSNGINYFDREAGEEPS